MYSSSSYFLSQGAKGFWRNRFMTLASCIVLTSCLFVIGLFGVLIYNLYINLANLNLNEISVICDYDLSDEQVDEIGNQIGKMNFKNVTFVSKEEALEQQKELYSDYSYAMQYATEETNPLPDVYRIEYDDNSDIVTLKWELTQIDGVIKVNARTDIAQSLEKLKNGILVTFSLFMMILFFVSVIIIMNTIKMAIESRNKEIIVMRYVGATKHFISMPFLIESFMIGIISLIASYGIQFYLYKYIDNIFAQSYSGLITIAPFGDIWTYLLAGLAVVSIITCFIGCKISLRKHVSV